MALSEPEFRKSLAALAPAHPADAAWPLHIALAGGGRIAIGFFPAPPVTLGGLLALPRAIVTIAFEGASPEAQADFLRRFDIAFQRGGG